MTRSKCILVVDDDADLLQGLGIRLISHGYQVVVASNAQSAVTVAIRSAPDLVLLDLSLPGEDGMAVLARLKGMQRGDVPVLVISARDASWEKKVLDAGAAAFFQKPVDNDELFATIALALQGTEVPLRG